MVISGSFWTFARTAAFLGRGRPGRKALPSLLFFTDPDRTPDPEAIAARLPRGAAVVFRAFGAADAADRGAGLKAIARARGLKLLIGADETLAARLGADSLRYLPVESVSRSIGMPSDALCEACLTGRYPTPAGERLYQIALGHDPRGGAARTYDTVAR